MVRRLALILAVLVTAAACGDSDDDQSAGEAQGKNEAVTSPRPPSSTTSTTMLVAASGECGLQGSYPTPWPTRPRYEAQLEVDPVEGTLTGDLHVAFTPSESTDRLVFRLWTNGPRSGGSGGRMGVTRAVVDGQEITGTYESGNAGPGTPGTIFQLSREGGFTKGETVEVVLTFNAHLPGAINERIARVGQSLRLGSVLPTLSWLRDRGWQTSPAVGNFSESVASEIADYDVQVTVPEGFTVLATGEEVEPGRFVASAVRDWGATVGRLRLAEGVDDSGRTRVVVGVAEGEGDDPGRVLNDAIAALDDFASRYGPYPFPVLSVGVTGSLTGGIEFPQHLMVGAGTARDHLIHEVAHQWFYSLVGNDQYADPWLDEGLTEYAESRFTGTTASLRRKSVPAYGQGRVGKSHDYWSQNTSAYFRSVYVQGAQAVAALGDDHGGLETVDCVLRRYVFEHAFEVATPADFVASAEAQLGLDPRPVLERFGAV